MKLNDEVIAHIAKILQLAILTGTDVVDHMRLITLKKGDSGELLLDDDYAENSQKNIERMLNEIDNLSEE